MNAVAVTRAVAQACALEIEAFKPGNVSLRSAGHGMTAADFLLSAGAAAVAMTQPDRSVGQRIYAAVAATHQVVGLNTNLGIILLCAPLVEATLAQGQGSLHDRLEDVLQRLDRHDAEQVFAAIRLANPGGLGEAPQHDVARPAEVTLLEAMQAAVDRDRIAWQYAHGFQDVFDLGVPRFREGRARWGSDAWAAVHAYLGFLSAFADTHITRKFGPAVAERWRARAVPVAAALAGSDAPEQLLGELDRLDAELKAAGVNPGTSADLTVASILAVALAEEQDSPSLTGV